MKSGIKNRVEVHKGKHRVVIDDLFVLDKAEWLEDIERGESSLASYLACIDECISEEGM